MERIPNAGEFSKFFDSVFWVSGRRTSWHPPHAKPIRLPKKVEDWSHMIAALKS